MSTEEEELYTVSIGDADIASQAIDWAMENIPKKVWKLDFNFPKMGYDFVFKDHKVATLFSLKWTGLD